MPAKLLEDMTGQRTGRLVALWKVEPSPHGHVRWLCRCDCGNEKVIAGYLLKGQRIMSCGCRARMTHGLSRTPEYSTWLNMKARCYRLADSRHAYYGGAGVTVCEHWRDDFAQFFADMGLKPTPKHSLDKDHGPRQYWCHLCGGDVRWATALEQAKTTRHNPVSNVNLRYHASALPVPLNDSGETP